MRSTFTVSLLLAWCIAFGQQELELFKDDAKGRPLYMTVNFASEGSPYFFDEYQPARLTIVGGAVYKNVRIKFNMVDHLLQYLAPDGKEMVTEMPVEKIRFSNGSNTMLQSLTGALNRAGSDIYEVLDTGRIKLLKKITVIFRDNKGYGDAATTRVFERKEFFYSLKTDGSVEKIEKGKTAMLALLADKKDKIALFIDKQHISCKSETDYRQIFAFYNNDL